MELKKYSIKVIDPKYWEEVHNFLCHESSCDYIPDRPVSCVDDKLHSPTTGIFELDDVEAEELRRHPHI